jgi:hypothetical protein
MREPKKDEIVRLKANQSEWKVIDYCLGLVILRENKKHSRKKIEVDLSQIEYTTEEKPKKKSEPAVRLTRLQRGEILKSLVTEESIKENFQREIVGVSKLINKFPHVEFLLEGFKPAIKANSVFYWLNRPEVEQLYKNWSIDLTRKTEEIVLEKEKIGTDIEIKRKPKNLLELLG